MNVASFLKANLNDQLQFLLFTGDKENSKVLDFICKFKPITSFSQKNSININMTTRYFFIVNQPLY